MRDEHRPKQELIHEITGLRKQVLDLKEAMIARRRVEDALRATEAVLRSLTDQVPVGLGLFRRDGSVLAVNLPFARMLGYDSPAELQRVGGVLGIFISPEERSRSLDSDLVGDGALHRSVFRRKDGTRQYHEVITAQCTDPQAIAVVMLDRISAASGPECLSSMSTV
jgi:PAS domain S-box-containing protein